jgi:hypothetical protein
VIAGGGERAAITRQRVGTSVTPVRWLAFARGSLIAMERVVEASSVADDAGFAAPLIVKNDEGLALFGSAQRAGGFLEVPDVEAGVYGPAFDARGRLFTIELPVPLFRQPRGLWRLLGRHGRPYNRVVVRPAEASPSHQEALITLLESALPTPVAQGADRDLAELVTRAVEHFGVI